MSEVFEGVVVPLPGVGLETPAGFASRDLDGARVYFRADGSARASFDSRCDDLGVRLSVEVGRALVVRYDSRLGHRSSALYEGGRKTSSFGEHDELFVPIDLNGYPIATALPIPASELSPDEEYETVTNAIERGLAAIGLEIWPTLRTFIGAPPLADLSAPTEASAEVELAASRGTSRDGRRDPGPQAIVGLYFRHLGAPGPAILEDVVFSSPSGRRVVIRVARIQIPIEGGPPVHFVGSVGAGDRWSEVPTRKAFVGIYDADLPSLRELVASAAHYDRFVAELAVGHSFPLGQKSSLRDLGYSSALILGADLYRPFPCTEVPLGPAALCLLSVVPLTAREMAAKTALGLDSFLAEQEAEGRDWLSIGSR